MSLARLLVFAMLVALGADIASAQSQSNRDSLAVSQDLQTADFSLSVEADQLLPLLSLTSEPGLQSAPDADPAERQNGHQPQPPQAQFSDTNRHVPSWVGAEQGMDRYCLAIRSYRVGRDGPHSDSVHPVAYTTCVPAARVQLYTTVEQQR
jgi:hypothetical protein